MLRLTERQVKLNAPATITPIIAQYSCYLANARASNDAMIQLKRR